MPESNNKILRDVLIADYTSLALKLGRKLGSSEAAYEVLHEIFLRLDRPIPDNEMRNPRAYLFRMALNTAKDRHRADNRRLGAGEADDLLEIADERPGPDDIVQGRFELELLKKALLDLPDRRRQIFVAARIESIPHTELAVRFGVTVRMIEMELRHALEHCMGCLKRN